MNNQSYEVRGRVEYETTCHRDCCGVHNHIFTFVGTVEAPNEEQAIDLAAPQVLAAVIEDAGNPAYEPELERWAWGWGPFVKPVEGVSQ